MRFHRKNQILSEDCRKQWKETIEWNCTRKERRRIVHSTYLPGEEGGEMGDAWGEEGEEGGEITGVVCLDRGDLSEERGREGTTKPSRSRLTEVKSCHFQYDTHSYSSLFDEFILIVHTENVKETSRSIQGSLLMWSLLLTGRKKIMSISPGGSCHPTISIRKTSRVLLEGDWPGGEFFNIYYLFIKQKNWEKQFDDLHR